MALRVQPAGGVGHQEEVPHALELCCQRGFQGQALDRDGVPGRADDGHRAADHPPEEGVGLPQELDREVGLERQPAVELAERRGAPLEEEREGKCGHRRREGDGVAQREPPADGGHVSPGSRTRRHGRCG